MFKKIISIVVVLGLVFTGGYFTAQQLIPSSAKVSQGPKYSTKVVERGDITQGVNLTGQLNGNWGGNITAPKPEGITNSQGNSVSITYTVEELFVEQNQMVKKDDPLVRLSISNIGELIEEINDAISKKQEEITITNEEIDRKLEDLGKKINKDIKNVNEVNPYDGIVISAPIKGRLTNFNVEEGEKIEEYNLATIVDDSKVKISFKVNTYEYENLKKGDKVFLRFLKASETGSSPAFDGFYYGTIDKLNSNKVPDENGMTYVHTGVIVADNPGLIQPGMIVLIYTEENGTAITNFSYNGKVESFVDQKKVYSTIMPSDNNVMIATEVEVNENEFVEEGQPLLRIAGSDIVKNIESDIKSINDKYTVITNNQRDITDLRKKIDKISELTTKLIVTAPTAGMVSYMNYNVGETIQVDQSSDKWTLQLLDMYNTDEMYVHTSVSDLDVLFVNQDAPVKVTVDALPGEVFDGKVIRLDQYTDRDGKTEYTVQIKVEGREGLRPGMNTNCFVDSGESLDTLLVPIEAVFEEHGKQKVEVLVSENEVEIVEIEIGLMNDMYVEVLSGLEEGQLVVTGSTNDLMPSQSVPENDSFLPKTNE